MAYLELKNISYTYPLADEPSIKNVNLILEKGKVYAILGANGSGKTTLCNIIRRFAPDFFKGELEGEILLEKKALDEYSLGELSYKMGYVFQNPFNQISGARDNVFEEIAYGLENFGVEIEEIKKRVEEIMVLTNTDFLRDKNPFELSGGQQQRVAFASVLVLNPDILIIDEPTSQLDPKETERVFDIISQLKEMEKTILLVEHKSDLLAEYADEVIVLHNGQIIRQGEKHEIMSDLSLQEFGIQLPLASILAKRLKENGVPISGECVTIEEVKRQLGGI